MHPASYALTSLQRTLTALLTVIEDENELLARHDMARHGPFTERKNQALRELMAVQRLQPDVASSPVCKPLLARLKSSLARNANLLQLNITAVGETSAIIIRAMREAESDGTYSRIEAHSAR